MKKLFSLATTLLIQHVFTPNTLDFYGSMLQKNWRKRSWGG